MANWLKKTIIFALAIEAIFFIAPRVLMNFEPGAILVSMLGDLTNQERQSENLSALKVNPLLSQAAELKAEDMVQKGYFAHTSPEGKTPWYWLDQVGYEYNYAGENLAINFTNTEDVTAAWMKSPTHRANIEKSAYTEMGSGIATGTYKGKEAVFVVQVYANPREIEPVKLAVATPEENKEIPKTATVSSGEVLGTTTEVAPEVPLTTNLTESLVPKDNTGMNKILLIIFGVAVALLVLCFIIEFAFKHVFKNILILVILFTGIYFININFLKIHIFGGGIDYSQDQVQSK